MTYHCDDRWWGPDGPGSYGPLWVVGCGQTFEADPDDEGNVDCPFCGMWMAIRPTLVAEWVERARDMGREHARAGGPTSDDTVSDIIDLNAYGDVSWGELAELQGTLEEAYEEGRAEK